jgi:Ca2+-binding RTX toxin-like protein
MSRLNLYDVLDVSFASRSADFSVDPYAGQTAGNGKIVYSAQEAADNLNRYDANWLTGNYGALNDKVLTFGFWTATELQNSYYNQGVGLLDDNGDPYLADADQIAAGHFGIFTDAQKAMATANLQLWDDLIAVSFQPASSASEADITFGFVQMSPAAGAHAYYPQAEAIDEELGGGDLGKVSGDVWGNWLYSGANGGPNIFADTSISGYAWDAITHEIGHTLGLAHGGDYNASDDEDGDGVPDPITYDGDAYFFQDNQQYTIMSYFGADVVGSDWVDWSTGYYSYGPQTPMVHDILAVQTVYGADFTTRAGDTVYGFNSTAGNIVYDFSKNQLPVLTIWDGAGNDTLDLSGYTTNSIIDINQGAFSSAGHGLYEYRALYGLGNATQAQIDAIMARNGYGDGGRPEDNIAIAYGAEIENAIGGSGNDQITGNELVNKLIGNAGNDKIWSGDGSDRITLGAGADTFFVEVNTNKVNTKIGTLSFDVVTDFDGTTDKIDLGALDANAKVSGNQAFAWIGTNANKDAGTLSYKVYDSMTGAEKALGMDIHSTSGAYSGKVTVVMANFDGGSVDHAVVLLGAPTLDATDFVL